MPVDYNEPNWLCRGGGGRQVMQQNTITHSHKDSHAMTPGFSILPRGCRSISRSGKKKKKGDRSAEAREGRGKQTEREKTRAAAMFVRSSPQQHVPGSSTKPIRRLMSHIYKLVPSGSKENKRERLQCNNQSSPPSPQDQQVAVWLPISLTFNLKWHTLRHHLAMRRHWGGQIISKVWSSDLKTFLCSLNTCKI